MLPENPIDHQHLSTQTAARPVLLQVLAGARARELIAAAKISGYQKGIEAIAQPLLRFFHDHERRRPPPLRPGAGEDATHTRGQEFAPELQGATQAQRKVPDPANQPAPERYAPDLHQAAEQNDQPVHA